MTSQETSSASGTKLQHLAETDLFQDLSMSDLEEIARTAAMTTCHRGRVFYTPGETGEVLFILKQGRVALYRVTDDGRKIVTATVEPGTIFGEMALVGQGMADSYAESLEDCTLCVMSRADVIRLIERHPSVAVRLLHRMGRRLSDAEERLADTVYKPVDARLASALVRLAGEDNAPIRLSHQDLAEIIGSYRETVTRTLNEWKAAGLLEQERMQIRLVDPAALRKIAAEASTAAR